MSDNPNVRKWALAATPAEHFFSPRCPEALPHLRSGFSFSTNNVEIGYRFGLKRAQLERMSDPIEAHRALLAAESILPEIIAAYLHGSAVGGGLRPQSDVDLFLVVRSPLTDQQRLKLIGEFLAISAQPGSDSGRALECIVFSTADLERLAYPARCELIYGEWLRTAYEAGVMAGPFTDPEFTLLIAQARLEAKPLKGCPATELLPPVGCEEVCRASRDLLPRLMEGLEGDARNVLLTLARMWRTAATGDFVSKDAAAEWALPHLSAEAAALLEKARQAYLDPVGRELAISPDEVLCLATELHDRVRAVL